MLLLEDFWDTVVRVWLFPIVVWDTPGGVDDVDSNISYTMLSKMADYGT